jgi:hypothetical protein
MFVAQIEPEYLLIHIAVKMHRFHADVSSIQSPLQARPEVLNSIRMDVIPNIAFDVVDDFVN